LGDSLRGDERRAFTEAGDRGIFSNTWAQTLASGGEGRPMTTSPANKYLQGAAYLFNAAEHKNRMSTFLAAYRLGRGFDGSKMTHEEALRHGIDMAQYSHFDYANSNRPRVLQNDAAKVIGLFKQYPWYLTYALGRDFRDMTRSDGGISPEDRLTATKAFSGMMLRSMMYSGVTGLPLLGGAVSLYNMMFGDKDRPFDAKAALHDHLKEEFGGGESGQRLADAIMTGPAGAVSGASLSTGASYANMWYKPPSRDESTQETFTDALAQLGGAIPAIGMNAANGIDDMLQGNLERGAERMVPPAAAGAMKAARYAAQGARDLRGRQIMKPEEFSRGDIAEQAVGFTPQRVADRFAVNTTLKNISTEIQKRRQEVSENFIQAYLMDDKDGVDQAQKGIDHFNEVNPRLAIKGSSLAAGARNFSRHGALSPGGVYLPPGLEDIREIYDKENAR
jgi:hypothetical protein